MLSVSCQQMALPILRVAMSCPARMRYLPQLVQVASMSAKINSHRHTTHHIRYYQHPEEDLNALPRQHYLQLGEYRTEQELLEAGVWPWEQGIRSRLPEHYKKRFIEFFSREPVPVHYRPIPGRWKKDAQGNLQRVENVPLPLIFPRQADEGLWGGEAVVQGLRKKDNKPLKPKTPRVWKPHLVRRVFHSEILDEHMAITVTMRLLDLVDQACGFDNYILQTAEIDMRSKLGMTLKRHMLLALARKAVFPGGPERWERIYNKYSQFVIPEEEAEWVGLTLEEAEKKQLALEEEESRQNQRPLKELLAVDLIEKMKNPPSDGSSVEAASSGWMSRLNPFKENPTS